MAELQTGLVVTSENNKHKFAKFCRICGAKAASFNYNGLACESCKTFFRRNSFKPNDFQCYNENRCVLTQFNRKKCKRCRIDRCYAIGMKKELIWKSKYTQKLIEFSDDRKEEYKTENRNLTLNQHELAHLHELELAIANIPEEKSLEIVGAIQQGRETRRYASMYIHKFVKYCKSMSSFKALNSDDQLALVKSSYVQTLNIRFAFAFNSETGKFPIMSNEEGTKAMLVDTALMFNKKNVDPSQPVRFIKFHQSMNFLMENDAIIRNLIIVQFLFANRNEALHKFEFIRHQYYFYCTLLLRYYEHKHQCTMMARQKYFTLMQALRAMDYQIDKIRQMCAQNGEMVQIDAVHKEIFDL